MLLQTTSRTTAGQSRRGRRGKMTGNAYSEGLARYATDLGSLSAALLVIAEEAPGKLSASQAAFFLAVVDEISQGRRPTLSSIKERSGERLSANIRNSYRIFMEPSRLYPEALGWLGTEGNPADYREKLFVLTEKGRNIVDGILTSAGAME